MCLIDALNKTALIWIGTILAFSIGIIHIVFGILRPVPYLNTNDFFNLSPFFDFFLSDDECYNSSVNIFHSWGGWNKTVFSFLDNKYITKNNDAADIKKINGKYFCYKNISYLSLLNNGQIIKNGAECPKEYKKNCGRIDTLNQELCIKENEKCPLYDIGIGSPPDKINYNYNKNSNIYFNNDNYNSINKTIIGKLILNDGQPCYNSNEKLWRQFNPLETLVTHLSCSDITVFGKNAEDRFQIQGNITYRKIYQDNLNENAKQIIMDKIGDETVSLYKREFYGLDKMCYKKFPLFTNLDSLKNIQNIDSVSQVIEGVFMACFAFLFIIFESIDCCSNKSDGKMISRKVYFWLYFSGMAALCGLIVPHILAYIKIKNNTYLDDYNCSDTITNEIIRKGNENNKKILTYNKLCLFLDVSFISSNFLVVIIGLLFDIINKHRNKNELIKFQDEPIKSPELEIPFVDYPINN